MEKAVRWSRIYSSDALILAAATLAVLLIPLLPEDLLAGTHSMCVFKLIFGRPCPGCGMTRAVWSLLHGDIASAVAYNWKIMLVAPLGAALYVHRVKRIMEELCIVGIAAKRFLKRPKYASDAACGPLTAKSSAGTAPQNPRPIRSSASNAGCA